MPHHDPSRCPISEATYDGSPRFLSQGPASPLRAVAPEAPRPAACDVSVARLS